MEFACCCCWEKVSPREMVTHVCEKTPKTFSPPRDNPPPTCEELLRIADEMGGRDMMRFAR